MATTRRTIVQDELHKFLVKHSLDYNMLDIDDVVLDYVITILEDLGNGEDVEENIDVDQFIEMMDAYVPGFGEITSVDICEWMFQLSSNLAGKQTASVPTRHRQTSISEDLLEAITPSTSDIQNTNCVKEKDAPKEEEEEGDEIKILREMFPAACAMEVTHCLGLASGDIESAIQLILDRQESGECIKQVAEKTRKKPNVSVLDDKDLKDTLIARYSYVDADEHKKTFSPLAPKAESKKMVRYLENRIVTTKGEKFTEVKKDEDEDMKKTYVNLKPARKYRFH
ncbi:CUE domain-containing protein 2-like [Pecten maximus]|uniref:CUE domain-containing protein 2-like n=1 Tax=Pecten maximus TaxID=6579 RepID=UPI0014581ED8|nr:CUE domain-containing protein 2-like [Pecten maximus]XP_033741622.1 CUE domain-containing protein 2-like [Pecten maximus]XP_033741623.1 CUE domain-containing protein 2-like [Pecten maximus]